MDTSSERAVTRRRLLKTGGAFGAAVAAAPLVTPSRGVAVWVWVSLEAHPVLGPPEVDAFKDAQAKMDHARSLGWDVMDRAYNVDDFTRILVRKEVAESEAESIERAWQRGEFNEKTPVIGQLGGVCGLWIEKAAR